MFRKLFKSQDAVEAAIILITFVMVASAFAFTILSADSTAAEKHEESVYTSVKDVPSSIAIQGVTVAKSDLAVRGDPGTDSAVFTVSLVPGGEPLDLTDTTGENAVVIGYRDAIQYDNNVDWRVAWIVNNGPENTLLEAGERAEITVDLTTLDIPPATNTAFTLEIKLPTGAIFTMSRTIATTVESVMELR